MPSPAFGPKSSNAPKRVIEVITLLRKVPEKINGKEINYTTALAKTFGFSDSVLHEQNIMAAEVLRQLFGQVQFAFMQLKNTGLSSQIYCREYETLLRMTNPAAATNPWKIVLDQLNAPLVTQALNWSHEVLPEDGALTSEKGLIEEGLNAIQQIKELLQDPELEDAVRTYIEPRIRELELAFRVFPVCGIQSLAAEVDKLTGAIQRKAPELVTAVQAASKSSKGKSALKGFLGAFKTAGEVAGTANSLKDAAENLVTWAGNSGLLN